MKGISKKIIARLWEYYSMQKPNSIIQNKKTMENIIKNNRQILKAKKVWITDDVISKSVFSYGIPQRVRHLLNSEIGNEITNTDLLIYLSGLLKQKVNYLELGVSAGKNFLQVEKSLQNSSLTGFDIEEINPNLEEHFKKVAVLEWETKPQSIKKSKSYLNEYVDESNLNVVKYLSGDILDENSWEKLNGNKFNLIFSDALHEPNAILFEFKMIQKYNLLNNDEFIIMWDDLGGEMTFSFMKIWFELKLKYSLRKSNMFMIRLRGWLGINEAQHAYGVIFFKK